MSQLVYVTKDLYANNNSQATITAATYTYETTALLLTFPHI